MARRTHEGPWETRGRAELAGLAAEKGQVWIAERLRVNQGHVSRWISGDVRPEHHMRIAIRRLAKKVGRSIPETDWLTPEERVIAFGPLTPTAA